MVRREQQDQRALRKESKALSDRLGSPYGDYRPPDRELCRHHQWESPVDDLSTVGLQFNIWRQGGKLVDFCVNVQVLTAEGWMSVERFDCCHGHCHLHPDGDGGDPETIYRLDCVEDVTAAFRQVEQFADERARIIRDKGA